MPARDGAAPNLIGAKAATGTLSSVYSPPERPYRLGLGLVFFAATP